MASQRQEKSREEANQRAERVLQAWEEAGAQGPVSVPVPGGEVVLSSISATNHDGLLVLDVYVNAPMSGDPHYRLVNPPLLVSDGKGGHKEDPLAAITEVIAGSGGRRSHGRVK